MCPWLILDQLNFSWSCSVCLLERFSGEVNGCGSKSHQVYGGGVSAECCQDMSIKSPTPTSSTLTTQQRRVFNLTIYKAVKNKKKKTTF